MKSVLNRFYSSILAVLGLISLAFAFLLGHREGRLGKQEAVQLTCSDTVLEALAIPAATLATTPPKNTGTGKYMGSKNGTKYYTPGCPAAKRIKPENYVWFKSADDAKLQGYSPGKC